MRVSKKMKIERLSLDKLKQLTELVLELWQDWEFEEEFGNYKKIIDSEKEICFVCTEQENYIAFIHLSSRNDYVEGAINLPE